MRTRNARGSRRPPAGTQLPAEAPPSAPRPHLRSGRWGAGSMRAARPARAEGRRRGARGGQPAEAASRAGGRSVRREPVGTGTLPAGPGGGRTGGTWRRCGSRDAGEIGWPRSRVLRDPRLWKLCAGAPTCSQWLSHPLGGGSGEAPRALRSAPFSARGPRLPGSPCAAPLLSGHPRPGHWPPGTFASILVRSPPTPLLCGLAAASPPLTPRSACARSEPREPPAAFCLCRGLLVHGEQRLDVQQCQVCNLSIFLRGGKLVCAVLTCFVSSTCPCSEAKRSCLWVKAVACCNCLKWLV